MKLYDINLHMYKAHTLTSRTVAFGHTW